MRYITKPNWNWLKPFVLGTISCFFAFSLILLCLVGVPLWIFSIGMFDFQRIAEDYCSFFDDWNIFK